MNYNRQELEIVKLRQRVTELEAQLGSTAHQLEFYKNVAELKQRLAWTKEKPTKEGYYWYIGTNISDDPEVREVIYDYTFEFFDSRSFENGDRWEPVSDLPGEWSSEPIQLPERK